VRVSLSLSSRLLPLSLVEKRDAFSLRLLRDASGERSKRFYLSIHCSDSSSFISFTFHVLTSDQKDKVDKDDDNDDNRTERYRCSVSSSVSSLCPIGSDQTSDYVDSRSYECCVDVCVGVDVGVGVGVGIGVAVNVSVSVGVKSGSLPSRKLDVRGQLVASTDVHAYIATLRKNQQ
jgi:hypothetical protein